MSKEEAKNQKWSQLHKRRLAKLRPGVIEAIQDYPTHQFKAEHLDSRYNNIRIGDNLTVLAEAGVLNLMNPDSEWDNQYELKSEDLEPAEEKAEEAFRYRIIAELEGLGEEAVHVTDDLEQHGVVENIDGEELIDHRRWNYDERTLKFLSDLKMIESIEEREFIADQTDIDYLESHNSEWMEVTQSLLENDSLPREYLEQKNDFT